ncbi:MAG: hypothetical protein AABY26_04245, partial [Nanoarchaeota archaeon]
KVAPDDPTIYPLLESSLGVACRTTRHADGALRLVEAVLPDSRRVKVVVKKVPEAWENLFVQELQTHGALIKLGYEREVTNPITYQTKGRIITYGCLAGDLSELRTQPEEVKQRELWKAVELLLPISLDLTKALGEKLKIFTNRFPKNNSLADSNGIETVRKLLKGKVHTAEYLTQRFKEYFLFRAALAKDGHQFREVGAEIFPIAHQVLDGKADLVSEEEYLKRINPDFKGNKPYFSVGEFHQYRHLLKVITSAKAQALLQHYQKTIAPALDALIPYVGHDDFTISNILATDIVCNQAGQLFYSGLKMHDVGLVLAPFQNYLYDLLVSANASPETSEELVRRTYRELKRGCEQRGGIPVQSTFQEFWEGYHLVSVDKYLKQASNKLMLQCLEAKEENFWMRINGKSAAKPKQK